MGRGDVDVRLLELADRVGAEQLSQSTILAAADLMLVGARCRDVLQSRQGLSFDLRATDDLDIGIALSSWDAYAELTSRLPRKGDTGIQFDVTGVRTDLMPFGPVEQPADLLVLPTAGTIRIPTIPGYTALKLAAWLDRSAWGQYKDAGDIAAAMHWYAASDEIFDVLAADDAGVEILVTYEADQARAAIHLLGRRLAELVGPERVSEVRSRWPGQRGDILLSELSLPPGTGWPTDTSRRRERLNAFEEGLGLRRSE